MSKEFFFSLLHNRILLFNIVVISAVLIFLLIANVQHGVDIEEYATVPYDHTPALTEANEYTGNVELEYDKDTFQIDYRIFVSKASDIHTGTIIPEEGRPLPMSPATTVFTAGSFNKEKDNWIIAVAIKKVTDEPAVYMLKVNEQVVAYFSDPFPTGYNSIVIYSSIPDMDSTEVRIEINKVRTLS